MSEADFTNYIQNRLADVEIFSDTQSSHNVEFDDALKNASKSHTDKRGYPDHIALVRDFVLVMEDKSDRLKLILRDDGELSTKKCHRYPRRHFVNFSWRSSLEPLFLEDRCFWHES